MNNENVKEAIGKYIESKELVLMAYPPEYIEDVKKDMEFAFRAGAKWMAEQGISCEGEIVKDISNKLAVTAKLPELERIGKFGDKVIVQIRKKQ